MIIFDDVALTVKVSGINVFGEGDHLTGIYMPGIYYIQIEAQNANGVPTGTQIDMIVTVTDPCD